MKLNEVLQKPVPDRDELRKTIKWLEDITGRQFSGSGGSKIQIGNSIDLSGKNLTKIPVRIDIASSEYNVSVNHIETLEDCGLPSEAVHIDISYNKIGSLKGISDTVKRCGSAGGSYPNQGIFDLSGNPITSGGIGLLLIEDLWGIRYGHLSASATKAFGIISKYIKPGADWLTRANRKYDEPPHTAHHNIIECQTELIDNGLEAFAEL